MFHFASEMMCNEWVHVRLVTQTLWVHQMYAFSYSILYPKVLGLRGIIKISTAQEKTAPYKPGCICACMLAKSSTHPQKWCYTDEKIMLWVWYNFRQREPRNLKMRVFINGSFGHGRPGTGTGWSERLRENSELHCSSKSSFKQNLLKWLQTFSIPEVKVTGGHWWC